VEQAGRSLLTSVVQFAFVAIRRLEIFVNGSCYICVVHDRLNIGSFSAKLVMLSPSVTF